jgi:hypothetical protein
VNDDNIGAYADDLVIITEGEEKLKQILNELSRWAEENVCEINQSKT